MKLLDLGKFDTGKPFIFLVRTFAIASLLSACAPVASTPPATITPMGAEATSTPTVSDLTLYTDTVKGFSFLYPKESTLVSIEQLGYPRIDLPVLAGTNLQEKYVEIYASDYNNGCTVLEDAEVFDAEFNGVEFMFQSGVNAGAGNYYEWERYTTNNGAACVMLYFVLHSTNPDNYSSPPPVFDDATERAVIGQILSTFAWSQ